MKKNIAIIGIGGFGREVLDLIEFCKKSDNSYNPLGFIVDPQFGTPGTIIHDIPILGDFDWLEKHSSDMFVIPAVGQPHLRFQMVKRLSKMNCKFISIIHPWTMEHLNKWVSIGEGVILNGCQTSDEVRIGNHVYINAFGIVGHDSIIMDYCTLGPAVHIDGSVTVGTGCFIGTGSNLLPYASVGEWSVIGAGSTISKEIPANSVALNGPPRIMSKKEPGWHLLAD
jgi:sugar O-acyltransferase (sialic acid O-acetyltransferase NeuD family)